MVKKLIAGILVAGLMVSVLACDKTETGTSSSAKSGVSSVNSTSTAAKLDGKVIVDGSGTVYPLMANIAEDYMINEQTGVSVQVGRAGSSAGFQKFIPGETDLSDSSRVIKAEEIAKLEEKGLKLGEGVMEIKLALDGLTIVINKDNTWATEMKKQEIIDMFLSGKFKADDKVLWSDIKATWPKEEVKFYGPNENHGTYEYFYEVILGKKAIVKTASLQQEYSTLVDLVSKDKNAIAFFGFGYYVSNKAKIKAVKVDFGNGAIEPSLETIGEALPYAGFTRPVFTYLNVNFAKSKPQVLSFAKYVVSVEGAKRLAGKNGFAPLPDTEYAKYTTLLEAIK